MNSTRILSIILVALVGIAGLGAQGKDARENKESKSKSEQSTQLNEGTARGTSKATRIVEGLDLSDDDIATLQKTAEKFADELRLHEADIAIFKAQLQKELLKDKPDMTAIKDLVHKTIVVEESVRIAQIERHLALRKILGDDRWAVMARWIRTNREIIRSASGKVGALPPQLQDLIRMMAEL